MMNTNTMNHPKIKLVNIIALYLYAMALIFALIFSLTLVHQRDTTATSTQTWSTDSTKWGGGFVQ